MKQALLLAALLCCLLLQQASATKSYTCYQNQKFTGSLKKLGCSVLVDSQGLCQSLCNANPKCGAYAVYQGQCTLYEARTSFSKAPLANSVVCESPKPASPPPPVPDGFVCTRGKKVYLDDSENINSYVLGGPLDGSKSIAEQSAECKRRCLALDTCLAFFINKQLQCFGFKEPVTFTGQADSTVTAQCTRMTCKSNVKLQWPLSRGYYEAQSYAPSESNKLEKCRKQCIMFNHSGRNDGPYDCISYILTQDNKCYLAFEPLRTTNQSGAPKYANACWPSIPGWRF